MKRPIALSLSPNVELSDVFLALRTFFSPWVYSKGESIKLLEQWFRQTFLVSFAVSFNSGRTALFAICKALEIGKDDEVIIQSFTCAVVPNAIIASGARPVYADVDSSLTLDPKDVIKKITPKTKAILFQYTFGIPGSITEIAKIAKEHKLYLIEDCAHGIGGEHNGKKLGRFGIASFFSFGRDKAFSSVFGGMAMSNNQEIGKKLRAYQKTLENPSVLWIMQQLFHPIAFAIILPLYSFVSIGKILLVLLQRLHFLSFPVSAAEKKGIVERGSMQRLPNALAILAYEQMKKMKRYNTKREKMMKQYVSELHASSYKMPWREVFPLLRFPLVLENRDVFMAFMKKHNISVGKWYSEIIDPKGTDFSKIYYKKGSCPNAEEVAQKIVNLPMYPAMSFDDLRNVIQHIKAYAADTRNN